ncbi:hypothetical protein KAU09_03175 [Candidatus Parcubacteria bacterium]|nr:hypothetical protein [Candidatus Parcubacteria bacterium]
MICIFLAICFCFLLISCSSDPGPTATQRDTTWSYLKSPNTDKCYEIITSQNVVGNAGYGYMGMSEIPCNCMPPRN